MNGTISGDYLFVKAIEAHSFPTRMYIYLCTVPTLPYVPMYIQYHNGACRILDYRNKVLPLGLRWLGKQGVSCVASPNIPRCLHYIGKVVGTLPTLGRYLQYPFRNLDEDMSDCGWGQPQPHLSRLVADGNGRVAADQ
jgi:hypothetical protein